MTREETKQKEVAALEAQLDSFDEAERRAALIALRDEAEHLLAEESKPEVNLHFHTFYSFNAEGWSPSRVAWEAAKYGLEVAGCVDFDVLDAMPEFLEAGDLLNLKTVAAIESRVFFKDYADKELNSPKEPGVAYFMGCGCFQRPQGSTPAAATLRNMLATAQRRNHDMMDRVNRVMGEVGLDYEQDVLTLTPGGNATERHLLAAYDAKSRRVFGEDRAARVKFWADVTGTSEKEIESLVDNPPKLHEFVRAKLMKFGGVGYVQPDESSFPSLEEAVSMIREIGALPTYAYLDGTSAGESDIRELLDYCVSKGVVALNIIPDRNWNIADADTKQVKTLKLLECIEAARDLELPLHIGTEMNKAGLPFVDNFLAPELAPFTGDFLKGAWFFYGHTLLARFADFGYWSDGARAAFGDDRAARNDFFEKAGASIIGPETGARLQEKRGQLDAEGILDLLMD